MQEDRKFPREDDLGWFSGSIALDADDLNEALGVTGADPQAQRENVALSANPVPISAKNTRLFTWLCLAMRSYLNHPKIKYS